MGRPREFPDLSLVIAFGDDEENIGHIVCGAAAYLAALGRTFEIIAVNEGSRDNTVALLGLLAARRPDLGLRIVRRDSSGRAFGRGAVESSGRTLVFTRAADADGPWAALGLALARVEAGSDAAVLSRRLVAARRASALAAVVRARGATVDFERRFLREVQSTSLRVDVLGGSASVSVLGRLRSMLQASLRRLATVERG